MPGPAHAAEESQPASALAHQHRYFAFGMTIHSDVALGELQPFESAAADLLFRRQPLPRPMPGAEQAVFEFGGAEAYLGFGGIGHFLLPRPGLVLFDPSPDVDPAVFNLFLLGSVMATVLQRRGLLTMHASGIDIGGRGAIFMGNKGAGKSTTAAAFVRAGHRLLTDDILPFEQADDAGFDMVPGYPQLKLSEMASTRIALPGAAIIPIRNAGILKSRLRLAGSFSAQTVAPAVFYVLAPGERFEAVTLSGIEAMTALMANAYHARFGSKVFHGAAAATLMRQCAALVRVVPVRLLKVPRDLARLGELVGFVERDMGVG
jgi:hypothetical protein